jgi:hypothetical protein
MHQRAHELRSRHVLSHRELPRRRPAEANTDRALALLLRRRRRAGLHDARALAQQGGHGGGVAFAAPRAGASPQRHGGLPWPADGASTAHAVESERERERESVCVAPLGGYRRGGSKQQHPLCHAIEEGFAHLEPRKGVLGERPHVRCMVMSRTHRTRAACVRTRSIN